MKAIFAWVVSAIIVGLLGACSTSGQFIKYEGSAPDCDKLRSPDSQLQVPTDPLALEKNCQTK
jgi:uncharacterized lipoprotein